MGMQMKTEGLIALFALTGAAAGPVCLTGYVVDYYCIGWNTWIDTGLVGVLEAPDEHTVCCP